MHRFSIAFEDGEPRDMLAHARIRVGAFDERFEVDLSFWPRERYRQQWRDGLRRILAGADRSCLIASMSNPATANFVFWWPVYTCDGEVVFQNQVLFLDELEASFEPSAPYVHAPPHETTSIEGDPISEWRIEREAIAAWLEAR